MKVKCDSKYAILLRDKHANELSITWDNGVMTVAEINQPADLASICAE